MVYEKIIKFVLLAIFVGVLPSASFQFYQYSLGIIRRMTGMIIYIEETEDGDVSILRLVIPW